MKWRKIMENKTFVPTASGLVEYCLKMMKLPHIYVWAGNGEYVTTELIESFADKYPDVTFIMAHLGSYSVSDSIAIEKAKHGNVYADTSGIASSKNLVIEYTVGRVGSERILFGTDTYATGFQRGRIEYALISEEDKENILRKNAERLFKQLRQ